VEESDLLQTDSGCHAQRFYGDLLCHGASFQKSLFLHFYATAETFTAARINLFCCNCMSRWSLKTSNLFGSRPKVTVGSEVESTPRQITNPLATVGSEVESKPRQITSPLAYAMSHTSNSLFQIDEKQEVINHLMASIRALRDHLSLTSALTPAEKTTALLATTTPDLKFARDKVNEGVELKLILPALISAVRILKNLRRGGRRSRRRRGGSRRCSGGTSRRRGRSFRARRR